MHILPSGQQPFLAASQEPTEKVLRDPITGQTWKPAAIQQGDTFWASDASGTSTSNEAACRPYSGESWVPFGMLSGVREKTTTGLAKR
jgi:hypothetical protein